MPISGMKTQVINCPAEELERVYVKSYARSQDLYQHRVIAQADLEQAESTRDQAQADVQAAGGG